MKALIKKIIYQKWKLPELYDERIKYANHHASILESKMIEQSQHEYLVDANYITILQYYIEVLEEQI